MESVKNLADQDSATVTLYAVWQSNGYRIRFNKNATDATGTMADMSMTFGQSANLTANAFARQGYAFKGWTRQADGGGQSYSDGQQVSDLSSRDGDVIDLYAVWEAKAGGIALEKVAHLDDQNGNGKADHDENISYSFKVTNMSPDVALSGVTIVDDLLSETITVGNLAAGASKDVNATKTHTVTVSDALAGQVTNTATVTGNASNGSGTVTDTATARVSTEIPGASITVSKQAVLDDGNGNGMADVGEMLAWKVTVMNTGDVSLSDVTLDDDFAGISGKVMSSALAPGASTSIDIEGKPVTAAQALSGNVENVADVTATPPNGMSGVTGRGNASVPTVSPSADIAITKTATLSDNDADGKGDMGESVSYTLTVTNTGNVDLSNVTVMDPMFGNAPIKTIASLAVGTSKTVTTSSHVITVDEAKAGRIVNTATATGEPPTGIDSPVATDTATVMTEPPAPSFDATKIAKVQGHEGNADYRPVVGDVISYEISVRNTGNVPLSDVAVNDAMLGIDGNIKTTLSPGETTVVTGTHVVTQANVDSGSITNTATVRAQAPEGTGDPGERKPSVTTPVAGKAAVSIEKKAMLGDLDGDGKADAGEEIIWNATVTNTGTVTLSDVTVTDVLTDIADASAISVGTLGPGDVRIVSLGKTIVSAEQAKSGSIKNTAHVVATPSAGLDKVEDDDTRTVPTEAPIASFEMTKDYVLADSSDMDGDGKVEPGDVIKYSITLRNTGNVELRDMTVSDAMLGWDRQSLDGTIKPGASATIRGTYKVTTNDMNGGTIRNEATGTAKPAIEGVDAPADRKASVEVPTNARTGLLTKKTVDRQEVDPGKVGEVLTYTISVENVGNTAVHDVAVNDPLIERAALSGNARIVDCKVIGADDNNLPDKASGASDALNGNGGTENATMQAKTLQPGHQLIATVTYSLTQGDIDTGRVENTATATGMADDGSDTPLVSTDTVVTIIRQSDGRAVEKSVDQAIIDDAKVGDVLSYTIRITNVGDTTVRNVNVLDSLTGHGLSDIRYSNVEMLTENDAVPANQGKTDTAPAADIDDDAGNGSSKEGTDTSSDQRQSMTESAASGSFEKTKVLLPGQSVMAYASYAVTGDDIAAGQVMNIAWVTYVNADGTDNRSAESTVTTSLHEKAVASDTILEESTPTLPQTGDTLRAIVNGMSIAMTIGGLIVLRRMR